MAERKGAIPAWKAFALRLAAKMLSPDSLLNLLFKFGLKDMDGFFCNFSGGNQGVQLVGQEIAKVCGSAHFLYNADMSPAAVRAIIRGPQTEDEKRLVSSFLNTTVHDKENNYRSFLTALHRSGTSGRKVLLFGTPYLLKELCEKAKNLGLDLRLKKGSQVVFGGGWKSFEGERIGEEELLNMIRETFGIRKEAVTEGYSMTEIQCLMMRCTSGRYHVPPYLSTVILDPEFVPKQGNDVSGILAVLDPFAWCYPGFLITGDSVRLIDEPCPCGRPGPAIISIERTPGREVKGCGGIMAKVNA
jgi:hypothetical protein